MACQPIKNIYKPRNICYKQYNKSFNTSQQYRFTTMPIALPGDPLVVSDKVYHEDEHGDIVKMDLTEYQERRVSASLKDFRPTKILNIQDLPEQDHKEQLAIAAVTSLILMGLTVDDITQITGVDTLEIQRIINSGPAQSTFEMMYQSLINVSSSSLQGRIAAYGDNAVSVVARLMNDEEAPEMVQLKAAQDVLDRSGTNPKQFFDNHNDQGGGDDELRITIFDEDSQERKVEVDIKRKK